MCVCGCACENACVRACVLCALPVYVSVRVLRACELACLWVGLVGCRGVGDIEIWGYGDMGI